MIIPSVVSCIRRLQFSAGHRVYGHEGKCAHLHGHNYVVYFHAVARELDFIGRVIDFSILKEILGGWIDTHWDHGMLLYTKDPIKHLYRDTEQLLDMKLYICEFNPTAEELAKALLFIANDLLTDYRIRIHKVVLYETENCYAEVEAGEIRL